MRAHGLADAHAWPLVSWGKDPETGAHGSSWRVPPWAAWAYPSLELRTPNSLPALIFDIDGRRAWARALAMWWADKEIPAPNWTVERGPGGHAVYTLASPVHLGALAAERPLKLYARVYEYLGAALEADAGYAGVLTHNPVYQGRDRRTTWGPTWGYELRELADYIPDTWRMPRLAETGVGRNVDLHRAAFKWAGSRHNLGRPVLPVLERLNARLDTPLPDVEVGYIARSAEKVRRSWMATGSFYSAEDGRRWGRSNGIASGQARRARTAERDERILEHRREGLTQREIAALEGVHQGTVSYVLKRFTNELRR